MSSVIDIILAVFLIILGALIYKNGEEIVPPVFLKNIKNVKEYCKTVGKAIMLMSLPVLLSSFVFILTADKIIELFSCLIMIIGIALCLLLIWIARKKYANQTKE